MNDATQFFDTTASGGYQVERSLRFNSSDSAYLSRTPASAGNRKTWTWAGWVKRSVLPAGRNAIFNIGTTLTDSEFFGMRFQGDYLNVTTGATNLLTPAAVYRDTSAWYHIVLAADTTLSSNRFKLYINGELATQGGDSLAQNTDLAVNGTFAHEIGRTSWSFNEYLDAYLADVYLIDGQALDPTSFGEFDDNGIWQPIAYTGTYGTNGFHLPFSDNSTAAALGTDTSGNGNTWTVNNITASVNPVYSNFTTNTTNPKNAFDGSLSTSASNSGDPANPMVFSSLALTGVTTFEYYTTDGGTYDVAVNGGSFSTDAGGSGWRSLSSPPSTITSVSLKNTAGSPNTAVVRAFRVNSVVLVDGVPSNIDSLVDTPTSYGTDTGAGGEVRGNYATLNPLDKGSTVTLANGNLDASVTSPHNIAAGTVMVSSGKYYAEFVYSALEGGTGGLVGVCNPLASRTSYLGGTAGGVGYNPAGSKWVDGVNTGGLTTSAVGDVIGIALDKDSNQVSFYKNNTLIFTQTGLNSAQPYTFAMGHNNSAGSFNFGQRQWAYAAPSGFRPLVDTLLPAPVVAKSSDYFQTVLYTGNGSTQTISGLGFSPDLVWIKGRSAVTNHRLLDTVRGATKELYSSETTEETTQAQSLTAFNSDGFSLGSLSSVNGSSTTFVAWTWDAGSSTVTNTQGSITSQVRANPSAGFSIVSYVGTQAAATVGHGLGVAPSFIIAKCRGTGDSEWAVYHKSLASGDILRLNNTVAAVSSTNTWDSTAGAPTSTVFRVNNSTWSNASGQNMIAYCFAPVAGYSSFGSYTGNGSTDGPFVFTGMRPRWVMIKASSSTGDWYIIDTSRDTYNLSGKSLQANTSNAEPSVGGSFSMTDDILSNGFKLRDGGSGSNGSSVTYVYAAFAENPFQYARAR